MGKSSRGQRRQERLQRAHDLRTGGTVVAGTLSGISGLASALFYFSGTAAAVSTPVGWILGGLAALGGGVKLLANRKADEIALSRETSATPAAEPASQKPPAASGGSGNDYPGSRSRPNPGHGGWIDFGGIPAQIDTRPVPRPGPINWDNPGGGAGGGGSIFDHSPTAIC